MKKFKEWQKLPDGDQDDDNDDNDAHQPGPIEN